MMLRTHLFRRVTIAGVGLMGGSLALAMRKYKIAKEIVGLSNRQSSLVDALKDKVVDRAETDVQAAVKDADLVVLATPVDAIMKIMVTINPYLRRNCIVTDVGSVKLEIVEAAQKTLSSPAFFVGAHPLVGSEKKGLAHASAELFENQQCILTPVKETNRGACDRVKTMWTKIGANVKFMSPEEHDETMAYISHMPHLLSFGLMNVVPDKYLSYATRGLKDTTRIAASSAQVWNDIFLANSKNTIKALDALTAQMSSMRKAILEKDSKVLLKNFSTAKEKRDTLT